MASSALSPEVAVRRDAPGLFEPCGTFWKVNRENVLFVGAGCALLLQLAHPMVAAGVDQHSDFLRFPLKRLYRTVRALQSLLFGRPQRALEASRGLARVHGRIHGHLVDATAVFPSGTPYTANDPTLLLWVHATLVHTSLVTYETFLPPLNAEERSRYYGDSKLLGRLFGVPEEVLPPTAAAFRDYMHEMVHGRTITVSPTGARLARAVLDPPLPFVPPFLVRWNRLATTALLPAPLREGFGLPWNEDVEHQWERLRDRLGNLLRRLPDIARAAPSAKWAERRWRRAQVEWWG